MKKRLLFLGLIFITLFAVASCTEPEPEPEQDPYLTVSPSELSFAAEGGSQVLTVSANVSWTASVEGDCFTVSPASGKGDGKVTVTAIANVNADPRSSTITFTNGWKTAKVKCSISGSDAVAKEQAALDAIYKATGGPNWTSECEIHKNAEGRIEVLKYIKGNMQGQLPPEIGNLTALKKLTILDEPGLTGPLPAEIRKLVNLEELNIMNTSITDIPDVFDELNSLKDIEIIYNESLSCPLPESLGAPKSLRSLTIYGNNFTGSIPESWARLKYNLIAQGNRLSGTLPDTFFDCPEKYYWLLEYILDQQPGYGFDINGADIHGGAMWPSGNVEDVLGNQFSFEDVIKKNKYTVYLIWASWCPFSKELVPEVLNFYNKYKQDGLDVIATSQIGGVDENGVGHVIADFDGYKSEVVDNNLDKWHSFYWPNYAKSYFATTPNAEVYDSNGNIVFSSFSNFPDPIKKRFGKTASSDLIPFLETLFGPALEEDDYSSTDYSKDGKVTTLQTATVGNGIDIVFMGDAYTDKDISSGLYETVMNGAMNEFFAVEPYKTFRNRFNVYAVNVVSKNGWIGNGYETALSTTFGDGSYAVCDIDKCYEYALKVPSITSRNNLLVTVMINTHRHAGTAHLFVDGQTSVALVSSYGNNRSVFGSTVQHEAGGHGFAFLADEYSQNNTAAPQAHIDDYNSKYNLYGWFSNVDFTDDPAKIRWSAFLSDDRYKNQVGIFEGGALYSKGVWRPTANSIMNMNYGGFNAPSRWAIYKRIMELSGESYSFDSFLEYDEVNRRAASQASYGPRRQSVAPGRDWQPGAPPVIYE
ncbi:MAG: hypothetical protein J5693_05810 [Bacteroidales bacterium]|nr:hypothetical protein [Bacteroidales bacterium]